MSVAYQSWEVASGPTMGYNMAMQSKSNMCSISDSLPPDASSFSVSLLGSPESFLKAVAGSSEMSKNLVPNLKMPIQHDTVARGFSSLSLHSAQDFEASNNTSMDSKRLSSNEGPICSFSAQPVEYYVQGKVSGFTCSTASGDSLKDAARENMQRSPPPLHTMLLKNNLITRSAFPEGFSNSYCSSKHKLGVVVEDKALEEDSTVMDDLELDSLSSSSAHSVSSLHDAQVDGCTASGDGSCNAGDADVESEYRGLSRFSVGTSPPKKGLSRFYVGKSRSFSCLGDVVSLKDLAKPENPYAKKRKGNVGRSLNVRPQLPPLQKGAASISKKLPYNGKATLALAVVMSAKDDEIDISPEVEAKNGLGVQRWQGSLLTLRSYSLSDLQGVTGTYISPS